MDSFEQMVTAQLDKVLSSEGFVNAPQLQNFLLYVVNRHIQDKSDRIDAYAIATQALGRPIDFAPDLDPIVRVQAANLRQRLDLYNASMGANDPIKITLPKGGYTPVIEDAKRELSNDSNLAFEDNHKVTSQKPSILPIIVVEQFDCTGSTCFQTISGNMSASLVLALNRFDTVNVIPSRGKGENYFVPEGRHSYRLYGSCRSGDENIEVVVFLVNIGSGICIYSRQFEMPIDQNSRAGSNSIVSSISSSIAEISGAIFKNVEEQFPANGLHSEDAYGLVVHSYKYFDHPNEEGFELAKSFVAKALNIAPNLVLALCRQTFIYMDGYRFLYGGISQSRKYLSEATECINRAIELSPSSSQVNLILSDMLFASGKYEEAITAGEFAIELNPENHQIAAIHGFRRAAFGDWEGGLRYVRNAVSLGHYLPNRLLLIEMYRNVYMGDYKAALASIKQVNLPDFFIYQVYLAGLNNQLGNVREAREAFKNSLKLRPGLSMDDIWEINMRTSTKEFAEATRKLIKNVGYA